MAFEIYKPVSAGRRGLDGCITISSTQIYFGKAKLPFDRVQIEYDKDVPGIRFSEGTASNSFKLLKNPQGGYYINALRFINKGLIPTGRYEPKGKHTYVQN